MDGKGKLLVVARKFNDIFYAMSTSEWTDATRKTLLIITDKLRKEDYPELEAFDEVCCVQSDFTSISAIPSLILKLRKTLKKLDFTTVTISNIAIVANKYILNSRKCKSIILLEDGIMNYRKFKESQSASKSFMMNLLGISNENIQKKILKTYLLDPSTGNYFFGEKVKLHLRNLSNINKENLNLDGKRFFIGQPLYLLYVGNNITVEEYNKRVNEIIRKYQIHFYVPHTMSSNAESIDCDKFDIGEHHITFEVISALYNLEFYSISSSVLYSTKIVNPQTKCHMIIIPEIPKISDDNILYRYVDDIFYHETF